MADDAFFKRALVSDMDWPNVTRRVVIEAIEAHPQDVVLDLGCGTGTMLHQLAPRIRQGIGIEQNATLIQEAQQHSPPNLRFIQGDLRQPAQWWPTGVSVALMHDSLRALKPNEQAALLMELGRRLPERGLLVIGDVIWSLPPTIIDEPEQFGDNIQNAPTATQLESMIRTAGFLPDLHRFGPGRGVMIALKAEKTP